MTNELDNVAAVSTAPALPKLFFEIDRKAVDAATDRAWPAALDGAGGKLDAARVISLSMRTEPASLAMPCGARAVICAPPASRLFA